MWIYANQVDFSAFSCCCQIKMLSQWLYCLMRSLRGNERRDFKMRFLINTEFVRVVVKHFEKILAKSAYGEWSKSKIFFVRSLWKIPLYLATILFRKYVFSFENCLMFHCKMTLNPIISAMQSCAISKTLS